jgi:hypothetical protein
MSAEALEILEKARALPPEDQRRIAEQLLAEEPARLKPKPLEEVLGKHKRLPDDGPDDHNRWFVKAIESSKRG